MTQTISQSSVTVLLITTICMLLLPAAALLLWRRHGKIKAAALFAGVFGFLFFARVLEMIPHALFILTDNPASRFVRGTPVVFVLYGALMAGIFEECGRYFIFRRVLKKHDDRETAITYGIGHGGIEVLVILAGTIGIFLVMALVGRAQGPEAALGILGLTAADAGSDTLLSQIAAYAPLSGFTAVFERIVVLPIQIELSVIVFYAAKRARPKLLLSAVLAHAALDIPAAACQAGVLPIWVCEVWLLLCAVGLYFYAAKLYRAMVPEETVSIEA